VLVLERKRTEPSLLLKIANDVRALRTSQALPLTDRKEVLDACHQ